MAINKVIYGDNTLMDLTGDTVSSNTLLYGAVAHNAAGEEITGSIIVPEPASNLPADLGTAAVGTSEKFAREDHVHSKPSYSKSDVGLGNVDNVQQYSVNNPPPYPVTSVNGATGNVSLAIPSNTSDLTNDSNFITGMEILSYGNSTWNDFITAYNAKKVVYCRASSNSNPASGSQTRLAFMAYVNDASSPTNVEFQYYRSVNSHSDSQQGDQVYVYKLTSAGTWTVTVRENYTKIVAGTGLSGSYNRGVLTLTNDVDAATATPENLGTAAVGSSTKYAREDHVHDYPDIAYVGSSAPSNTNIQLWLDTSANAIWQGGNY